MKKILAGLLLILATIGNATVYTCPTKDGNSGANSSIFKAGLGIYTGALRCKKLEVVGGGGNSGGLFGSISSAGSASGSYYAVLREINPDSGTYVCDYYDSASDNGVPFISCSFQNVNLAKAYRSDLSRVVKAAEQDFQTGGNSFAGYIGALSMGDNALSIALQDAYSMVKKFSLNINKKVKEAIEDTYKKVNKYFTEYTESKAEDRIYTFSTFLAGLVTLDPEIVAKYDPTTGKLVINNSWKDKASNVLQDKGFSSFIANLKAGLSNGVRGFADKVSSYFFGGKNNAPKAQGLGSGIANEIGTVNDYKVASWLEIFEMKLWGFYYDLMRKFDIAYAYLINYMLLLMGGFFGLLFAGKAALNKYLEKRSIPGASDMWTKMTVVLGSIAIFYVSPATPSSDGGGRPDFYYNQTIMKNAIRTIGLEGSRFATAFSDLGLSAYLNFIAHKEYIVSDAHIRENFVAQPLPKLIKLLYTVPIADECVRMYGYKKPFEFLQGDGEDISPSPKDLGDSFTSSNSIKTIDYKTCARFAMQTYKIKYDAYKDLLTVLEEAKNRDTDMVNATRMVVYNMNMLEDSFGWVNVFTVPFSYYIFKFNDMFMSPNVDYDKIEEAASKYVKSLNLKEVTMTGDLSEQSSSIGSKVNFIATEVSKTVGNGLGYLMSVSTYMVMPGFSEMYKAISGKFDSLIQISLTQDMINAVKERGEESQGLINKTVSYIKGKIFSMVDVATSIPGFKQVIGWVSSIFKDEKMWEVGMSILAFILTIALWKMLFKIAFISLIALIILLKIVLFFVDLLVYFLVSTFVVLWAFTTNSQQLIFNFLKKGLVLLATPSIIVFTSFVFLFVYELMNVIYLYLLNVFIESQKLNAEALSTATWAADGFQAFLQLNAVSNFMEITIMFISLILAYLVIYKGTDWILETLGLSDARLISSQGTQEVMQKGEKYANPLA